MFIQISSRRVPALGAAFAELAREALAAGGSGLRAAVIMHRSSAEHWFQVYLAKGRKTESSARAANSMRRAGLEGFAWSRRERKWL